MKSVAAAIAATAVVFGAGPTAIASVRFVHPAAPANGDGSSWASAYTSLAAALDAAADEPNVTEIWVAAGTYKPAPPSASQNETFALVGGTLGAERNPVAIVSSCTFASNSASSTTGGIFGQTFGTTLESGVLWLNTVGASMSQAAQITHDNGFGGLALHHSCVQRLTGSLGGVGNRHVTEWRLAYKIGSSGFPVGDAAAFRSPGSVRRPAPEKRKAIFRAAPLGLQRVRSVMWAPDRPPSPSHAPDPCGGDATATAGSLSSVSPDRTAICRWRRDSSAVRQASSAGAKGRRGLICIRAGRLPTRKPEAP